MLVPLLVLGARDVDRAVRFWSAALDLTPGEPHGDNDFTALRERDGTPRLCVQHSDEDAMARPRLHLDLYAADAADQAREIERLVDLGARLPEWPERPEGSDYVVLADPEGNAFCVIDDAGAPAQFRLGLADSSRPGVAASAPPGPLAH